MPPVSKKAALPGIKLVTKKLADGSTKAFYYDRATKLALGSDLARALARKAEIEKLAGPEPRGRQDGTLSDFIAKYKAAPEYVGLAPRTKALWRPFLKDLEERVGDWPPRLLTRSMASKYKGTLIKHHGSGSARNRFKCFARVWNWALSDGYTEIANPFSAPGSFAKGRKVTNVKPIWRRKQVDAFLAATRERNVGGNPAFIADTVTQKESVPDDIRLAFILGLLTTQRLGDVLRLTADKIRVEKDGRWWIKLRQGKTDTEVEFPVHQLLRAELERQGIKPGNRRPLVQTQNGGVFDERNFSRKFRTWMTASKIKDLNFQALRRSGMVWLAEAGTTTPRIAALSGHSIAVTQKILDSYIVKTKELAAGAVDAFERVTDAAFPSGFRGT